MQRAESAPAVGLSATGDRDEAITGPATDGSHHGFAKARTQNSRQPPLTVMLEREEALRQLIPVCPRCYHFDLCRAVDVNQCRRLLLSPERLLA
ncbi:hypothetical protein [Paenarthrobacter nitroguajacolicus]|uniref:hypothetical protein n=1 Tax=Paenarthrobacter nitroguajacolicus TaxID=211146 RepID=UPI00211888B2|nr:hypothetical protein [Paenarthrobacter nitroguajacolicus]